jgi:glucose-1-phosphate cytidylyltransferase
VFSKKVFDVWKGKNLESNVFPRLAGMGTVFTFQHHGFWKSMDTSKDQQELEAIYRNEGARWLDVGEAVAVSSGQGS